MGLELREGEAVARPAAGPAIDLVLACVLFALIAGVVTLAQRWNPPARLSRSATYTRELAALSHYTHARRISHVLTPCVSST
jgi:hypothetical protein